MTASRVEQLSETVTLHLGDCRDVLPSLPRAASLISDVPYGIGYNPNSSGKGAHSRRNTGMIAGDNLPFDPAPWLEFERVVLWGSDHFYPRLPDRGRFLAFDKLDGMAPWDSFTDVEFAWCSVEGAARIFSLRWKGIACVKANEGLGRREHPTQKPIALMAWCIEQADTPPQWLSDRPVYGFRHNRRRRGVDRPQVHRLRDRAKILRRRVPAHQRRAAPSAHEVRSATSSSVTNQHARRRGRAMKVSNAGIDHTRTARAT